MSIRVVDRIHSELLLVSFGKVRHDEGMLNREATTIARDQIIAKLAEYFLPIRLPMATVLRSGPHHLFSLPVCRDEGSWSRSSIRR